MKIWYEDIPSNICDAYVVYEGQKRPEYINTEDKPLDLERMQEIIGADALEFDIAKMGETQFYLVICDSMGRLHDRAPTALDSDKNVAFVGTIIVVQLHSGKFSELGLGLLKAKTCVATIAGRFSEKDITDMENVYVLKDIKVISDKNEIRMAREGQSFPRKKWGVRRKKR